MEVALISIWLVLFFMALFKDMSGKDELRKCRNANP